jgi:hypothetical protein
VLLTGLANFVQPLVRYDLGDSVTVLPERCACGSPLPALRVQGRRDDIVTVRSARAEPVALLPLALTTVIEDEAGVFRFQLLQQPGAGEAETVRGGNRFVLRVQPEGEAHAAAWQRTAGALRRYAATLGVPALDLADDGVAPEASAVSGKLRRVCAAPRID